MKTSINYLAPLTVAGCTLLGSCWADSNSHSTSISVHDTPERYEYEMVFEKQQTPAINQYLDSCFGLTESIGARSSENQHIVLNDTTTFDIESAAGRFHIVINKATNPPLSVARIRKICSQIRFVKNTK